MDSVCTPTKTHGDNFLMALKGMRLLGVSFRLCAVEFWMTRNAVAGICWRQGWCVPKPRVLPTPPILFPEIWTVITGSLDRRPVRHGPSD